MNSNEFEGMCRAASKGEYKFVENLQTHELGKVLSCGSDEIQVDVQGKKETWRAQDCAEKTHGYKPAY